MSETTPVRDATSVRSDATAAASGTTPARSATARAAAARDDVDPLAGLRRHFVLDGTSYLDGNSLGALPAAVPGRLAEVVAREWGELRIRSWTESGWWTAPERVGERIAPLMGAAPGQVVAGDSTSVNVFKALVGAVRLADGPGGKVRRDEILVDAATFPTDGYIAASAARMTGRTLRPLPVDRLAAALSERTAAVLVNHVDYRTGELHPLPELTAAAHRAGAPVVWDLCHSAGALPVEVDAHGVDFAVGCGYKYLNGGPGAPAFLYIAARHQAAFDSPLPGWNSHAEPFAMADRYTPADGSTRGRVGTPDILSLLALEEALKVWEGVDLAAVRAKSLALTDFFLECVAELVPRGAVRSLTPVDHRRRGSQIALRCADAEAVMAELIARGVVGDFRAPDVLRFGFTPLYTAFADAERAARVLGEVLRARAATPADPAAVDSADPAATGPAGGAGGAAEDRPEREAGR